MAENIGAINQNQYKATVEEVLEVDSPEDLTAGKMMTTHTGRVQLLVMIQNWTWSLRRTWE